MRKYKIISEVYIKTTIILISPIIILLYCVLKNFNTSTNIAYKTALLSASFENPPQAISQIKNKFSNMLTKNTIDYEKDSGDENLKSSPKNTIQNKPTTNTNNSPVPSTEPAPLLVEEDAEEEGSINNEAIEFVPEEYRGTIIEETYKGGPLPLYVNVNPGYISNRTKIPSNTLIDKIKNMPAITMQMDDKPQVLLFSTHATESFEPCDRKFYDKRYNSRSTDNDKNMTKVEDKIAEQLINNGINTIVDKTQHDFPSYNGSYNRSAQTIKNYLSKYPSIQVILDIHRDAIERDNGERVKPCTMVNGKKSAQIMIISGCDDGSMDFPNWAQNLNFAIDLQKAMESKYPGLTRPIFFCYRKYNMYICPASLLIEVGSNSNSLNEAIYAGELMGNALADLLLSYQKQGD